MSFLDGLIKDPKYQSHEPRPADEVNDPHIIISPDTRREHRIPQGQSRTKKWPVLDAHGTPPIDLATWQFEVNGLVENPLRSEEHTSELQSRGLISYAVFCL